MRSMDSFKSVVRKFTPVDWPQQQDWLHCNPSVLHPTQVVKAIRRSRTTMLCVCCVGYSKKEDHHLIFSRENCESGV